MNAPLNRTRTPTSNASVESLIRQLRQMAELIHLIQAADFTYKPMDARLGSIGSHVRHALQYMDALLQDSRGGDLCYDDQRRHFDLELCRWAALRTLERRIIQLQLQGRSMDQPLRLKVAVSAQGPAMAVNTSFGRELAFVIGHTIHHNGMIAVLAHSLGIEVPDRFGQNSLSKRGLERVSPRLFNPNCSRSAEFNNAEGMLMDGIHGLA